MSWSLTLSLPKEEFNAALDALPTPTQWHENQAKPIPDDRWEAVKQSIKAHAGLITRPIVSVSANGHTLMEGEGDNLYEGVSLHIHGVVGA